MRPREREARGLTVSAIVLNGAEVAALIKDEVAADAAALAAGLDLDASDPRSPGWVASPSKA